MYAIYSIVKRKNAILAFIALLFLFSNFNFLRAQLTGYNYIPTALNSWTPDYKFPKYGDAPGLDSVVRTNFTITMRDGVIIDALKFVPVRSVTPAGGYMTVIMVHGYGDNKETLAKFCMDQATYGYYTMTFSVRGQGLSGGVSNLISDVEALDMLEVIKWVKNDSLHGSNPGKILIMGGSQGGLLPMKAVCMGGQPVTTLISALAPPNFASDWIANGSIKMTCLWTMDYTSDTARYSPEVVKLRNWILANTKAGWDSLARVLPIGRDFVTSLPNCNTPVFVEGCWQDKFFNASGWLDNITSIHSPFTSYFGAVQGHGGDRSLTEDTWHMNQFNNWFLQWLWGVNTGILNAPKYQYAYTKFPVTTNYWTFVHDSSSVPLNNITSSLKVYICPRNELRYTPNTASPNSAEALLNDVDPSYSLTSLINDEFKGPHFGSEFNQDTVIFESYQLTHPVKWVGAPIVHLDYSSTATGFCQFNFQIFEVMPNGQERLVNRANFTDRNYVKNSRRTAVFKGQAHAHTFQTGNIIRLRVTNFDRTAGDSVFFGSSPFVLPVMNKGTHKIYMSSNSYIDLPVTTPGNPFRMQGNNNSANKYNSNGEPFSFSLMQNYPNPFNPATVIAYSIPNAGNVELKVYDLLGQEVRTLVNENQNPGSYSVLFNAADLPSGVYFYRIKTGTFTDIHKMILVK